MSALLPTKEIKVILQKGVELKLRNPDLSSDSKVISAKDDAVELRGVEVDVRGNHWIIFPALGDRGLPLTRGNPNIRKAWEDTDIEIFRVTSAGDEEFFT